MHPQAQGLKMKVGMGLKEKRGSEKWTPDPVSFTMVMYVRRGMYGDELTW